MEGDGGKSKKCPFSDSMYVSEKKSKEKSFLCPLMGIKIRSSTDTSRLERSFWLSQKVVLALIFPVLPLEEARGRASVLGPRTFSVEKCLTI